MLKPVGNRHGAHNPGDGVFESRRHHVAYKNKEDQKAYARKHYEENKEAYKARAKAHDKIKQQQIRDHIIAEKSKPCMDCGVSYPSYVMDFDHVRGTKSGNVSAFRSTSWSLERVKLEIAKCEIVCSNCHRERTHSRLANDKLL